MDRQNDREHLHHPFRERIQPTVQRLPDEKDDDHAQRAEKEHVRDIRPAVDIEEIIGVVPRPRTEEELFEKAQHILHRARADTADEKDFAPLLPLPQAEDDHDPARTVHEIEGSKDAAVAPDKAVPVEKLERRLPNGADQPAERIDVDDLIKFSALSPYFPPFSSVNIPRSLPNSSLLRHLRRSAAGV